MTQISDPDLGRTARKRLAILAAARTVFLRKGYAGTSMDEVAALAEVSKQTVYKQFADKERLFTEIIVADIEQTEALSQGIVDALAGTADLETDLRTFARQLVTEVTQPHLVRLRRIIIGEADRFPDLARAWYERGPERAYATMADRFGVLARRGLLRVEDPLLAAQHFHWLVLSVPLNKAMFRGDGESFATGELERYADEAVRVFLAAYGSAPEQPAS